MFIKIFNILSATVDYLSFKGKTKTSKAVAIVFSAVSLVLIPMYLDYVLVAIVYLLIVSPLYLLLGTLTHTLLCNVQGVVYNTN